MVEMAFVMSGANRLYRPSITRFTERDLHIENHEIILVPNFNQQE
jgi:hypothetical protein